MKHSFSVAAYDTPIKYCGGAMTYSKSSGKNLKPFKLQTLRQLDTIESFVWTRPEYTRNEAGVAELSKLTMRY